MEYISYSTEDTERFGQRLAACLQPGDVVAYRGDLGAGKTAFTRGIARGLGVTALGGLPQPGRRVRGGVERKRAGGHGGRHLRAHR